MVAQRRRYYLILAALTLILLLFHFQKRDAYRFTSPPAWQADDFDRVKADLAKEEAKTGTQNFNPTAATGRAETPDHPDSGRNLASDGEDEPVKTTWDYVKQRHPVKNFIQLPEGVEDLPMVQATFPPESEDEKALRLERQAAVKAAFERCWKAYRDVAWKRDEVFPISDQGNDFFGGWGATLIDSLDTLWIMDMKKEFKDAVDAAVQIDFGPGTNKQAEINVFETNIRFLGGLLSAYDLSGDERLLEKAKEVGDMLYVAFDTPNRMPVTRWRPMYAAGGFEQVAHERVLAAEIGSFSMEFSRLSQLTRNPKWFDAAQRITDRLYSAHDKTRLPGMFDLVLNGKDGKFDEGGTFKLGAMADSMYEYFLKTYAMLGGRSSVLKELYEQSASTAIKHTIFRPYTPDNADILMVGEIYVSETGHFAPKLKGEHLGCFVGGLLALGGKLMSNKEHVGVGRKLTDGCIWAYKNSPLGIMPEAFEMEPCPRYSACEWSEEKWREAVKAKQALELDGDQLKTKIEELRIPKGFIAVLDPRYILRPEAIESVFVLYRTTGDKKLMDEAWDMFEAVEKNTRTDKANAGIKDVTVERDPDKIDRMESFWLAETLKYFYLIFSEPNLVSLDEYVYNTEAHPFKRPVS